MPNALTGDFDLVLEVSESTLERLVASMHQNGFANPDLPSLPHIARFRIGDDNPVDGEHGSVEAQIGVPRIVLIDGASDRFWLEIGFRARYRADPGSAPLADVIHGTIRALYRVAPIDPHCPGWSKMAGDYLWLRVVRSSVSFEGSAYRTGIPLVAIFDDEGVRARLNQHLAGLLAGQFEPKPHAIGPLFRRMVTRSGPAGAGVAIPLSVDGSAPQGGDLHTITRIFLQGSDFAVAISSDYIVRTVQEQLDPFTGYQKNIHHTRDAGAGGGLILDYHARVDGSTTEWLGGAVGAPGGIIKITINCHGWASRLYRSGVFNIGSVSINDLDIRASAEQYLMLMFDQSGERLVVSAMGEPAVKLISPLPGLVKAVAENMIRGIASSVMKSKIGEAQATLDTMAFTSNKQQFIAQLKTIDADADAFLTGARFDRDGIVVGGAVRVRHRHAPHIAFAPATGDHFDAIETWLPGGRVDRYEWSWRWFTNPIEKPPGPAGSRSEPDSFYLERPARPRSRFGPMIGGESPLPGLDGWGEVCLSITGVQVDATTGQFVPVRFGPQCVKFGYQFKMPFEMNGPYLRVCDPLRAVRGGPAPEIGRLKCAAAEEEPVANTLVVFMDSEWHPHVGSQLAGGLRACRRTDAGLLVMILFREGALQTLNADAAAGMSELRAELEAPLLVTDDIDGAWARWLALNGQTLPEWRLIDPHGITTWVGSDTVDDSKLAEVLNDRLVTSKPALVGGPPHEVVDIGKRFPVELGGRDCPPIPLQRAGTTGSRVLFADTGVASAEAISHLSRDADDPDTPPCVAIVFTGASPQEVRALRAEHDSTAEFVADPDGSLTRKAGVSFTPSAFALDAAGRIVSVQSALPRQSAD